MFKLTGTGRRLTHTIVTAVSACIMALSVSAQTPPTHPDLVYAVPGPRHELDIYIPAREPCGAWPLVIYVHGGGWLVGQKEDVAPYVDELLSRGFAIASLNYRYSYQAIFPAQIHDIKGAVRWLRANAAQYNLDPTRFGIFGDSAGGHLAGLMGTSYGVPELESDIGGNTEFSSEVQIAGVCSGPTDLVSLISKPPHSNSAANLFGYANWWEMDFSDPVLLALVQSADPATHATKDDAPHFIVHGTLDELVPMSQAQHLHDALTNASVSATLTLLEGEGHTLPPAAYLDLFDDFAEWLITPPLPGDFNCDGIIDVSDLLAVISAWGPCVNGSACPDANGDGLVNVADLLFVITNWSAG